jgi:hypothetical protein
VLSGLDPDIAFVRHLDLPVAGIRKPAKEEEVANVRMAKRTGCDRLRREMPRMIEHNKGVVRRWFREVWNEGREATQGSKISF